MENGSSPMEERRPSKGSARRPSKGSRKASKDSRQNLASRQEVEKQVPSNDIVPEAKDNDNILQKEQSRVSMATEQMLVKATEEKKVEMKKVHAAEDIAELIEHDNSFIGRCKQFIRGPKFDCLSGALVVINSLTMFLDIERQGYDNGVQLNLREDEGGWTHGEAFFGGLEHVYNVFFILELMLRFWVHKTAMFYDASCVFDMLIVASSVFDSYLLPIIMDGGSGANLGFARLARILRVVRVMRAFRAATLFAELRVLIRTLLSSVMALVWSVVLLGLLIFVASIFLAQLIMTFIEDPTNELEHRLWAYKYFGSASRSTWSMFEATLSGGWPNYARPMIEDISTMFAAFWLVYVVCVIFAVLRVITALFLRATMVAAANDDEMMVMHKMQEKEKLVSKLRHFFKELDTSGDGMLDREEFDEILEDPRMQAWLHVLELEVYEVTALFNLLDDGNEAISCEEFIGGAMRLKGNARAIDSITMMHEQHMLSEKVHQVSSGLHVMWNNLALDSSFNPWPAPKTPHHLDTTTVAGIRVTIVGAIDLRKADASGHSDPYCECFVPGKKKMHFKTDVIQNTENPAWECSHKFMDFAPDDYIVFQVWDSDTAGEDQLGRCELDYENIFPSGFEGELELDDPHATHCEPKLIVNITMLMKHEVEKEKPAWQKASHGAAQRMEIHRESHRQQAPVSTT